LVTFGGKLVGFEVFKPVVEALRIIIDRRSKGRPRKKDS